jgi:hypothetical protein
VFDVGICSENKYAAPYQPIVLRHVTLSHGEHPHIYVQICIYKSQLNNVS